MTWINKVSETLAIQIHKRVNRTSVAVLRYAINDLLNYLVFYCSVVLLGVITGRILDSLIAPIAFSIIKRFSGGIHLTTDTRCTIASALMVIFAIYTPISYWYNGFILNLISLIFLAIFAPSGSHAPRELHSRFRIIAVSLVLVNFLISNSLLSKVFFIQALTTIPYLQVVLDRYKI